jgi:hypothetical protein
MRISIRYVSFLDGSATYKNANSLLLRHNFTHPFYKLLFTRPHWFSPYFIMVIKWDQKAALASVKETFADKHDVLKESYERLIPALEKKRDEIQAAGPSVNVFATDRDQVEF